MNLNPGLPVFDDYPAGQRRSNLPWFLPKAMSLWTLLQIPAQASLLHKPASVWHHAGTESMLGIKAAAFKVLN